MLESNLKVNEQVQVRKMKEGTFWKLFRNTPFTNPLPSIKVACQFVQPNLANKAMNIGNKKGPSMIVYHFKFFNVDILSNFMFWISL